MDNRWNEIKTIWKEHPWLYILAGFLLGLLCFPFLQALRDDASVFLQSLVPEAVGIVFAVLIIDRVYERRERAREGRELKARLIRELGSRVNEVAKRATEELQAHGWIVDGSLRGINLESANLEGTQLNNADLQGAYLSTANLQQAEVNDANLSRTWSIGVQLQYATLHGSNLEEAHFGGADFKHAHLSYANLRRAKLPACNLHHVSLESANLEGADMQFAQLYRNPMHKANLEGANLSYASLEEVSLNWGNLRGVNLTRTTIKGVWLDNADLLNAKLETALFDEAVTLPDGTSWTPETDLRRFTDPTHPDFWRSDDPASPAYRGHSKE